MVVENTHGLLAASNSHVKSEVVSQRVVLWLEPVVVSLLTQPSATMIMLKASLTVLKKRSALITEHNLDTLTSVVLLSCDMEAD